MSDFEQALRDHKIYAIEAVNEGFPRDTIDLYLVKASSEAEVRKILKTVPDVDCYDDFDIAVLTRTEHERQIYRDAECLNFESPYKKEKE